MRLTRTFRAMVHRLSFKISAAIIGVAGLGIVVVGGINLWLFVGAQMKAIAALHRSQAAAAGDRVLHFVDDLESHLRWMIAPSWDSVNEDDRRIYALRSLRALPPVSTIRLLDPQGREQLRVSRLGPDAVGSGADLSKTQAYSVARRTGRQIGPVYFQDGSEPYVTMYVSGTAAQQGSVVAELNLKLIWDIIAAIRIGAKGRAFLIDSDGHLISHPDISLVLRRADVSGLPQVKAALARSSSENQLVMGRDLQGREIVSEHAYLPSLGWSVVTELPRAEALAPVFASVRLCILVFLCGLTAAAACGILIARSMVRPIEILTAGAARIGSGALDHRIAITGANEFAQLGARFNEMAGSLQAERATLEEKVKVRTLDLARANKAKSRFLASASHDLRQPLHALSLYVEELQSNPSTERRARLSENLLDAVGMLNTMFDAILDTSKIEAGAISPSLSHFPLGPLLDGIEAMFGPAATAKGLQLEIGKTSAWVKSDRLLLLRILQNLVSNAVRYTDQGRVGLSCCETTGYLTIGVSDTGPGIPADIRSDIFSEFFRAATPNQSGERGLGLGLFIVENFAKLLGHPVSLHSEPGRGSRFEIRVPTARSVSNPLEAMDIQRHVFFGKGLNAAVVGDDPESVDATAELLRSWGFAVEATTSPAGLTLKRVDLLVFDYDVMRQRDAIMALVEGFIPLVKVVLITQDAGDFALDDASSVEVLQKPVQPLVLRAGVAKLIAQ